MANPFIIQYDWLSAQWETEVWTNLNINVLYTTHFLLDSIKTIFFYNCNQHFFLHIWLFVTTLWWTNCRTLQKHLAVIQFLVIYDIQYMAIPIYLQYRPGWSGSASSHCSAALSAPTGDNSNQTFPLLKFYPSASENIKLLPSHAKHKNLSSIFYPAPDTYSGSAKKKRAFMGLMAFCATLNTRE